MKGNLYTIGYAAVLGLVCATALTAVDALTREAYENNKAAKKAREIMKVLDVAFDADTPAEEIVKIREQRVKEDPDKAKLYGVKNVYVSGEGEDKLWAIAFEGEGMWKPIKGLLCLKADFRTVHRISFYQQEETPGLGARIAGKDFQKGFQKKTIFETRNNFGIVIKRRSPKPKNNEIDAITAATITCGKVEVMLNKLIKKIAQVEGKGVSNGG